VPAVRTSKKV
jgi:DNA-binding ferritin-like protein (Dps family)